jgi:cysteine desulfuration protein SufE
MTRLNEIIESFSNMEPDFRLELLLDYADRLPPIPERYRNQAKLAAHRVHECQTPVYLWVDVQAEKVYIYADTSPEAPTVQGFISMMIEAFNGASPQEVLEAPTDILNQSGLAQATGMRRMLGLSAIYRRIKQEVADKTVTNELR